MDPSLETEETKSSDKKEEVVGEGGNDAENEEESKALFDQPLVLEGKRKRKSTDLFAFGDKDKRKVTEYTGGKGMRLGDIPFVEHNISKFKAEQLKLLFKMCYDRTGTRAEIKRNLREFSGFTDESKELLEKKRSSLDRMPMSSLTSLCDTLGVDSTGKKEDIVQRVMEFLDKPADLGKAIIRKRRTSSTGQRSRKKSKPSESDGENVEDENGAEDHVKGEDKMDTSQSSTAVKDTDTQEKKEKDNEDKKDEVGKSAKEEPQGEPQKQEDATASGKVDEVEQPAPAEQQQPGAKIGGKEE